MIECYFLAPTCLVVTLFAALAELTFVRVVRPVAADAGDSELFFRNHTLVACCALRCFMCAIEREFCRLSVIEGNLFPFR